MSAPGFPANELAGYDDEVRLRGLARCGGSPDVESAKADFVAVARQFIGREPGHAIAAIGDEIVLVTATEVRPRRFIDR